MSLRRTLTGIAFAFIVGLLIFKQWNAVPCATSGIIIQPRETPAGNGQRPRLSDESVPVRVESRPADEERQRTPLRLSVDAASLLAEEVELRQLTAVELPLSDEQWAEFAALTLHYQAVRQAFEATIARLSPAPGGGYRLEIPAYPNAGDALRTRFQTELGERLGSVAATAIDAQLGDRLEGRFAGFGLAVQTLDFTPAPDGAEADYAVTRTITFWNRTAPLDRPTTRRETHFPGREDPTGHAWGPLLSVLATHLASSIRR